MIIILGLLILTVFIKIRYRKIDEIDNFLDKDYTTSIIGVFAVIIFFSHFFGYTDHTPMNKLDEIAKLLTSSLGQLMVVPFMFFSGYGIFEQYQKKGESYANNLPKNRIFKVYLMFFIAWIVYFALSFILKANYSLERYIWSPIAITSIGNSNWYVVVILVLYLSTYLSLKIAGESKPFALIINIILCLMLIFIFLYFNMGDFWWDSIPAYAFGLIYSYIKPHVICFCKKHKLNRYILFVISIGLTVLFGLLNNSVNNPFLYEGMVISFCLIFTCLLSLFHVGNKIVLTLGKYCFWIFILQRIPMRILYQFNPITNNIYLFFFLSAILTAALALGFDKLFTLIWSLISKPKLKKT